MTDTTDQLTDREGNAVEVRYLPGEDAYGIFVGGEVKPAGKAHYLDRPGEDGAERVFHHTVVDEAYGGRGLAGILVAPVLFVSVGMGALISLKAFAANIIGGFGNIPGAIVGGLALGVVETFGAAYISVPYKDALAFAVLLAFLLVRPQGLFGEKIAEKA